ncbi:hypothetical protein AB4090_07365 [Acidithiobacillus sp. IBUN Pt1247-S3]|uniref:hypothetical protein n=1 Tax=Acidithiobacillus sp. IBUN Pt1247-S3 TaxID=3166642 RepID=UPI0034E5303F
MNSDEYIAIVDAPFDTEETRRPFGKRWASQLITLKQEHLTALQQGKLLAIDDQGEYGVYLKLAGENHV